MSRHILNFKLIVVYRQSIPVKPHRKTLDVMNIAFVVGKKYVLGEKVRNDDEMMVQENKSVNDFQIIH